MKKLLACDFDEITIKAADENRATGNYRAALKLYESVKDKFDCTEQIKACQTEIDRIEEENKKRREESKREEEEKRIKRNNIIKLSVAAAIIVFIIFMVIYD